MIRFVRGHLAAIDADGVVVGIGGMGVHVRVSDTTRAELPAVGSEVMLQTHLVVREDALDLYGFAGDQERLLFEALLGVNGVGPRMALAICGLGTPEALAIAIGGGDAAYVTKAAGVGKKTAERVILELRDKVGVATSGGSAPALPGTPRSGAREGLVALGFAPDAVDAALAGADGDMDEEALVRHGLAVLGR
jgi:holliday junction DNA helicase RuvA